jgi:integrase
MSVYKRGGVYWYDFWFRGIRYRESTGLSNKTAAGRAEAIRKAELAEGRAGIVHRGPSPKFEDFVKNEFMPWSEKQHEAHPRTHRYYGVSSKPLIAFLGKLPLDGINTAHVEKFKMVRAEKVKPASTNRDLAALRYMLNFAIRQGCLTRNAVKGVKFLDEGPGMMRVVSHEEQKRYLNKANPLLRDIATLILETGMRPDEVFTLRKENVHLDRRYLSVPKGKTVFARRNIPLTDNALNILKRRMRKAKFGWLFPHRRDPHVPMTTIQKAHEEALKGARLKSRFRLYDLRHTFGSRSAMAGVDLATLKELMGHSNISVTMRYVHPTPEHKQEAVRKLERFNVEQVFAMHEKRSGSPQKSPQGENAPKGQLTEVLVN